VILKQLEEWEALAAKATPGPWKGDYCGDVWTEAEKEFCPGLDQHIFRMVGTTTKGPGENDSAFIAASRTAVPALCQEVRSEREKNAKLEEQLREAVEVIKKCAQYEYLEYGQVGDVGAFLKKWAGK